jgi:hypothetical protein
VIGYEFLISKIGIPTMPQQQPGDPATVRGQGFWDEGHRLGIMATGQTRHRADAVPLHTKLLK